MKNVILLGALLGGMSVITGCHMNDDHPMAGVHDPARYTIAYQATKDSDWKSSNEPDASTGTVTKGTIVYFDRMPETSETWQQARVGDGYVRWVHPSDYQAK